MGKDYQKITLINNNKTKVKTRNTASPQVQEEHGTV